MNNIEQQIGQPPGDPAFRLTAANRELVRQWMVEEGMAEHRAAKMRDATLQKVYAHPNTLRAYLSRGDYNPAVAKAAATVEPEPPPAEPPAPTVAKANGHDPAAILRDALRELTGQGVSEERIIELIYEHAPRAVALALNMEG